MVIIITITIYLVNDGFFALEFWVATKYGLGP